MIANRRTLKLNVRLLRLSIMSCSHPPRVCSDPQVPGVLRADEAAYGGGDRGAEWLGKVNAVAHHEASPGQGGQSHQAVCHEPQGHAADTGTRLTHTRTYTHAHTHTRTHTRLGA